MLQSHKASAEEVLHPPERTPVFGDPFAIGRARASGELRAIDAASSRPTGCRSTRTWARWRGASTSRRACTARCARRRSRCSQAIGAATQAIGGAEPLIVTSTVRDKRYQRVLAATDQEATHAYSLHTTGFAFDIARDYRSRAQALAFQFVLDRLTARGMIAWVREPRAIHVTVASR